MKKVIVPILFMLLGCVRVPENVVPIEGFEAEKYLGKWFEIARLDHSFERGLINVSAEYSLRDDGGFHVINRGYDPIKKKWKEAIGKAYFVSTPDKGRLKVSFFGPFYGAYNIIELDKIDYTYSMVCGPDRSYLWILSRQRHLSSDITDMLVQKAKIAGFAVDGLIFVKQGDYE